MTTSWIKGQIGTVLTAITLLIAVGISFGQLKARQDDLCTAVNAKADKATVQREMDQIHVQLLTIDGKLDTLILQHVEKP